MKRITVLSVALIFAFAVFSTAAMAAGFDVTANYGVRVAEKGVCEQVGAMTLAPKDDTDPTDIWPADTVITVELLAQAKICKTVGVLDEDDVNQGVSYDYASHTAGGPGYTVYAEIGDDFYTIIINSVSAAGDTIRVGHDPDSSICMDLSNTPYNSTDPNNQLVQVSCRDDQGDTYSSDTYVATVKPQLHAIAVCTKTQGEEIDDGAINGWSDDVDEKSGLIQIPLCFYPDGGQEQDVTTCGLAYASNQVCIQIRDAGNQFVVDADYNFTITTAKAGVGIEGVSVYDTDDDDLSVVITERRDINGDEVVPSDTDDDPFDDDLVDAVATKSIDFTVTLNRSGTQYIVLDLAYDTCTATTGNLLADVSFSKDPCGDSFAITGLAIANMVNCGGGEGADYGWLFPYSSDFASGNWWVGLALTNLTSAPNTVALDIYEADGDHYTASVVIPANGITTQLAGDLTATTTGADAQFGDERFWIKATSNNAFAGFLMMGDGAQAQGYLPEPYWKMLDD